MHGLPDDRLPFNRDFPRGRSKAIWSAELPLNRRDALRVELLIESSGRTTIDVRRCSANGEGSSKKGLAFDLRHLPSVVDLLIKALHEARAQGLLSDIADARGSSHRRET